MSSILKALKKVEDEKASRSDAPVDIARDILRYSGRPRKSNGILIAVVATGALVAAGVLGLLFSGDGGDGVVPPPSAPPALTDRGDGRTGPAVAENLPQGSDRIEKPMVKSDVAVKPSGSFEGGSRPQGKMDEASDVTPNRPTLVVTGIAFQQDQSGRLAVVNDLPVMEGTVIEGARIEEILEDRVRFEFNGRSFEVELGNP